MIGFKQYITEILDNPYPYTIEHKDRSYGHNSRASFDTSRGQYVVDCDHITKYDRNESEVAFAMDTPEQSFLGKTGTERNQSGRVFSTVRSIMQDHVKKYNPKQMKFTGNGSKVHLYDHLAKRSGYRFTTVNHPHGGGRDYTLHINESWTDDVDPSHIHHDVTPRGLMKLAKEHGNTRFVVNYKNRFNAGNAKHVLHGDLEDGSRFIHGGMSYAKNTGKYTYEHDHYNDDHPLFKSLEKLGCVKGERHGDWDDYTVLEALIESIFQDKIFSNASPQVIHNIAKNSKHKTAKFLLGEKGETHAATADNFTHDDIANHHSIHGTKYAHGYYTIDQSGHGGVYAAYESDMPMHTVKDHPFLSRLEGFGAVRGKYDDQNHVEGARRAKPGENVHQPIFGNYGIYGNIHESVEDIDIRYSNDSSKQVRVFRNPIPKQVENLCKTTEMIRTLKNDKDHYLWDANKATHGAVISTMGLPYNVQRGMCHRDLMGGTYDIATIHKNNIVGDRT